MREDILDFLKKNPVVHLATVVGDRQWEAFGDQGGWSSLRSAD